MWQPSYRRSLLILLVVSVVIGLSFAGFGRVNAYSVHHARSSSSSNAWPMLGFGPQRTNFNPHETTISSQNVSQLVLDWKTSTGTSSAAVRSSPAIVNGSLYVCAGEQVQAYNAQTGAQIWSATAGGNTETSSPAVANGIVYVAPDIADGNLYAFNAKTGAKLWVASSGGITSTDASPATSNGLVYENWVDGQLYAFNGSNGKTTWTKTLAGGTDASPVVSQGILYQGTLDGQLYAFNATTGRQLWTVSIPGGSGVYTTPAVANGTLYVGVGLTIFNNTPTLYAFNAKTGAIIWSMDKGVPDGGPSTLLSVAHGIVYAYAGDISAFNAKTGAKLWSTTTGGLPTEPSSSPSTANDVVYTGSFEGKVYAFNARTGKVLWSYQTGGSVFSVPIVMNGILYAGSDDFSLYAFHLPS